MKRIGDQGGIGEAVLERLAVGTPLIDDPGPVLPTGLTHA
jgi:hypothetical protein